MNDNFDRQKLIQD